MKLCVKACGSLQQVARFLSALRGKRDFRLLKLMGRHEDGIEIWLKLRALVHVKEVLLQMEGISQVDGPQSLGPGAHESVFDVRLGDGPSPGQAPPAPSERPGDEVKVLVSA